MARRWGLRPVVMGLLIAAWAQVPTALAQSPATKFKDLAVSGGQFLASGQPYSGTVVARDGEVADVGTALFSGTKLEGFLDQDTRGLVVEFNVVQGLAHGAATVHADLTSLAGSKWQKALQVLGAAKLANPRIATATFKRGRLNGTVTVWRPDAAAGTLYKFAEAKVRNNELHGRTRLFYPNGKRREEQHFRRGVPHGAQKVFYTTGGLESRRSLRRGKPAGTETRYYRGGSKRLRNTYRRGQLARDEEWFPSGTQKARRKYSNGKLGKASEWYSNGTLARVVANGVEKKHRATGTIRAYYDDGTIASSSTYASDGTKRGPFDRFYPNKQRWEQGTFENDVPVGMHRKWWKNGKLALDESYAGGKVQGTYRRWYASGQLWEQAEYRAGKRTGRYQKWWKNGRIANDHQYVDGGIHGPYLTFYDDGMKRAVGTYKLGKPAGTLRKWFTNGRLALEQSFQSGKPHGPYTTYYPNGQPRIKATYKLGKFHGAYENYLKDGTLFERAVYNNGRKTKAPHLEGETPRVSPR